MYSRRPTALVNMELSAMIKGLKSGRRLGDVKVAPDDFQRRLKQIDPGLSAHWNRIRCIWQIWGTSKAFGQAVVIHVCVGDPKTGTFEPLDARVFHLLRYLDGQARNVIDEMADDNIELQEKEDRDQSAIDADYSREELQPRLAYDLSHDVVHSKSGISIGAINVPKEDMKAGGRKGRFGAAPAPAHLSARTAAAHGMDMDIEVEGG